MSLSTGHPDIYVEGTDVGGDADMDFRDYLVEKFSLPQDALDNANGSQLVLDDDPVVGEKVKGTFHLDWDGHAGIKIKTARFKLEGLVCAHDDEDGLRTYLLLGPENVKREEE